jgi:hypothetical protein
MPERVNKMNFINNHENYTKSRKRVRINPWLQQGRTIVLYIQEQKNNNSLERPGSRNIGAQVHSQRGHRRKAAH